MSMGKVISEIVKEMNEHAEAWHALLMDKRFPPIHDPAWQQQEEEAGDNLIYPDQPTYCARCSVVMTEDDQSYSAGGLCWDCCQEEAGNAE